MLTRKIKYIAVLAGTAIMSASAAFAGPSVAGDKVIEGSLSFAHAPYLPDSDHDDFEYASLGLRVGYTFYDSRLGYAQALLGAKVSNITKGWGNYMAGLDFMLRWNFETGTKLTPYVSAGVGAVLNDAYKDETQKRIDNILEFTPKAAVGAFYEVNDMWRVGLKVGHEHISNAGLGKENAGTDSYVGAILVSRTFESFKKLFSW